MPSELPSPKPQCEDVRADGETPNESADISISTGLASIAGVATRRCAWRLLERPTWRGDPMVLRLRPSYTLTCSPNKRSFRGPGGVDRGLDLQHRAKICAREAGLCGLPWSPVVPWSQRRNLNATTRPQPAGQRSVSPSALPVRLSPHQLAALSVVIIPSQYCFGSLASIICIINNIFVLKATQPN